MKKLILFFISFFSLFTIAYAKGVELVSFEPIGEVSNKIEIIDDEDNNFNLNFLDSNLEISYKAIFKNTEDEEIKITSIDFNKSKYRFLDYSYSGLIKGELIKPNEEKTIIITIKTNEEDKETIEENFNLTFNYVIHDVEDEKSIIEDGESKSIIDIITNPETLSKGIIAVVIILGVSGTIRFILKKKRISKYMLLLLVMPLTITGVTIVRAEEKLSFSIKGIVKYTRSYKVTIDPNLGVYDGDTELDVREGEKVHLGTPTRETYEFVRWEINGGEIDAEGNVTIHANTSIKALWNEIYYTLTIDTDSGTYNGISGTVTSSYRPNEPITLLTPEKEGHTFSYWTLEDETRYESNTITLTEDTKLKANYTVNNYTVMIDTNGGTFKGTTGIYTESVPYGTEYDLSSITRTDYEITYWTKNNNSNITDTSIVVRGDVTLKANWRSTVFYNVYVEPNGGYYNDSLTIETNSIRNGETFTLTNNYRRPDYNFLRWEDQDGHEITAGTPITITKETTIRAIWEEIICSIGTNTYGSLANAHRAAQPGDTILLLKSTTEEFTNSKNITVDLNENTLTGSITNTDTGDLTLLNGTVENTDGTAITNDGILTIGVNDLKEDGKSNIEDNIAIIGTDIGIKQNNVLNIYDGYVEGDVALDGGYDDSPYYRNTFDGVIVRYYPFVNHNNVKDCQQINLEASDMAVSKTAVHGEIYYYNLQDNIESSVRTGYPIYAVRDFDASYPLTIPEGETIDFDVEGYEVTVADSLNINGTLNITDSSNNTGRLNSTVTITNNNELNLKDVTLKGISNNPLMHNKKDIHMENSTMTATTDYTYYSVTDGATIDMDDNSYISSTSTTNAAIYNTANDLEIHNGNVVGSYRGIYVNKGTLTVNGGNIKSESDNTGNIAIYIGDGAKTIVNGGNISAITNAPEGTPSGNSNKETVAFYVDRSSELTINGGTARVDGTSLNGTHTLVYLNTYMSEPKAKINGGTFTVTHAEVTGVNNPTYPLSCLTYSYGAGYARTSNTEINDGVFNINSKRQADGAHIGNGSQKIKVTGGTINITAPTAYGFNGGTNIIEGGDISVEAESTGYGINTGTNTISGGEIIVTAENGTGYGINGGTTTITGGKIKASTYGINNGTNIIGTNDETLNITNPEITGELYGLYGGTTSFYDGVLKGKTDSYQDGIIVATPDGAVYHNEKINNYHNTWLEEGENYLEVNGVQYNSMLRAYNAVEETGTIKVIKSTVSGAVLPEFADNKDITLDLNGNSITYSQSLINTNGSLKIIDSTEEKNGSINNANASTTTITNNGGTLTIESGNINGSYRGIQVNKGTLTVNGGNIKSESDNTGNIAIYIGDGAKTIVNGGNILAITNAPEGTPSGNSNKETVAFYVDRSSELTINGGTARVDGTSLNGTHTLVYLNTYMSEPKAKINGGTFTVTHAEVTGVNNPTYPLSCLTYSYGAGYARTSNTEINDGVFNINSKRQADGAHIGNGSQKIKVTGGTINITAPTAYGFNGGTNILTDGTINVIATSANGYGINTGTNTISGGEIIVTAENGTGYGINEGTTTITGGKITSSAYGINNGTNIIGTNDETLNITNPEITGELYGLYGGTTSFYDGVLKGKTDSYQPGIITAIPDGTVYHNETIGEYHNTWLEEGENYLEVNGVEYNSMTAAYSAVEETGTIKVIASTISESVLPEFADNKDITLDLNGNSITYSQSLINTNGSLKIIDSTEEKNGSINNANVSTPTITNNGGTLTIESGNINGSYRGIQVNKGTLTVNGGNIKSESDNSGNIAIYMGDGAKTIVNGGNISAITNAPEGTPSGNSNKETVAFYVDRSSELTINGGTARVDGTSLNGTHTLVYLNTYMSEPKAKINGGTFTVTHAEVTGVNNPTYPLSCLTYSYGAGYARTSNTEINDGVFNINSKRQADGAHIGNGSQKIKVTGGTINITAPTAYGFNGGTNIIEGGDISVEAESTGYGINNGTNTVTGGKIKASTYGIYNGTNTIGTNDETLSTTNPEIIGGLYAISGGTTSFYDGVLKGKTAAYMEGTIKTIPVDTRIVEEVQQINEENYFVDYLTEQLDIVENGDSSYKSLSSAISNSNEGDVLTVVGDIMNVDEINIPSDKNLTIDLNGHDITNTKPITNNGNLRIINSGDTTAKYTYYGTGYLITNNAGAYLELENVDLEASYVLKNMATGNVNINNVDINSDNTAIYDLGTMSLNNMNIVGNSYGVYISTTEDNSIKNTKIKSDSYFIYKNSTSTTTIENIETEGQGQIINNNASGTINIKDSNIVRTTSGYNLYTINNKGISNIDNTNVELNVTSSSYYAYSSTNSPITNSNKMTISNGSTISISINSIYSTSVGIENTGQLTIEDTTITNERLGNGSNYSSRGINNQNSLTIRNTIINVKEATLSYGIYNSSNTTTIESGTILSEAKTSYGVYVETGTLTLGIPEEVGSINYGRAEADVSITNPLIQAIGITSGIGVKNADGVLNYYDGKIVGTTAAKPEIPNKVEYLYEPKDFIDEETGYHYCILKWMREQQG